MSTRFGASSQSRNPILKGRLLFLGGGIVAIIAMVVVVMVVANYQDAVARQRSNPMSDPSGQPAAISTVEILAPDGAVPYGTKLSEASLRSIRWPRSDVPEGAVRRLDEVQEMYAKIDLPAGQPILRANLTPTPPIGGVADLIPANHRATTIEVDATSGVEGWATPGAHVDVLVTYQDSNDNLKKTTIAVEDAVVLSFNGQTKKGAAPTDPTTRVSSTATVTLAVPVMDALKIHQARAMGRISLLLRNTSDIRSPGTVVVSPKDIQGGGPAPKEIKSEPEPSKGFVRFSDQKGDSKILELRGNKWATSDNGVTSAKQ